MGIEQDAKIQILEKDQTDSELRIRLLEKEIVEMRTELRPIKLVFYSILITMLTGVVGALVALVIQTKP